MTGGESKVSPADIDTLLLDFMRVLLAQHSLHESEEIGVKTNQVWLHLDQTAPLFTALGLAPQSSEMQWMLIFKLYRELCIDVSAIYRDGTLLNPAKIPMGFHIDYRELSDEVMLDITPYTFQRLFDKLIMETGHVAPAPTEYVCKLWQRDNKLMLSINNEDFQVARPIEGMVPQLLTQLQKMPSGQPLNAIDFAPLDDDLDFKQLLTKNHYLWLAPMLPVLNKKHIALQNPSVLNRRQIIELVSKINEHYRGKIAAHLGITA
ncbi:MAG: hypothetical protein JWS12_571 [Candidatus Saccharibacteria bacterium]|nr:hypothetical protein [Candidatus Saccharibacteria bacterium]